MEAGSPQDSGLSAPAPGPDKEPVARQEEAPRKVQPSKRKGSKRGWDFDPKVFEARGRELQWEFYEIEGSAGPIPVSAPAPQRTAATKRDPDPILEKGGDSGGWMIWAGAAGLAGIAGSLGYYFMVEAKTETGEPRIIPLSDDPKDPP